MIESFESSDTFDHVLAINVLHEVGDRSAVIKHLMKFMRPEGLLHVTLPNPLSLHRLSALGSGMISSLCELSARGRKYQTLRLQNADEFVRLMADLQLVEISRQPVLIKPLTNAAMEQLSEELIEAYDCLSRELPEFGAMTYFMFRKNNV
jgi:2-polyprenyl-3-methyl-5-hydroxy-6-metoxy-1,4-benzoquinol methylase